MSREPLAIQAFLPRPHCLWQRLWHLLACGGPAILTVLALAVLLGQPHRARAQGSVRDSIRELEEAEARLRGGVYQVPIPVTQDAGTDAPDGTKETKEPARTDPAKKGSAQRREGEPLGIDILPQTEAGDAPSRALGDIAARISGIRNQMGEMRARILRLQEEMASRLDDVGYAKLTLVVEDAKGADTKAWPLAVHELNATLDGVPLVNRFRPRRLEREAKFPLYEGPLPAGEFEIDVRLVIGLNATGWPSQVGQGRWLVHEKLKLAHEPGRSKAGLDAVLVLSPNQGNKRPSLALRIGEAP